MKWFRGNDRDRSSRRDDDFDPVEAGHALGLTPKVSEQIWKVIRRKSTHNYGQCDEHLAQQRFEQEAKRVGARGGRLLPAPGTGEHCAVRAYLDYIAPGKITFEHVEPRPKPNAPMPADIEAVDDTDGHHDARLAASRPSPWLVSCYSPALMGLAPKKEYKMSSREDLAGTGRLQFKERTPDAEVATKDIQARRGTGNHDAKSSGNTVSDTYEAVQAMSTDSGPADRAGPWEADAGLLSAFGIKDVAPPQANARLIQRRVQR